MKRILFITALLVFSYSVFSQCDIETIAEQGSHSVSIKADDNVNTTTLKQGESVKLFSNFYKDQKYTITAISEDGEGMIEIRIEDVDGNLRYTNKENGYNSSLGFLPSQNEQLFVVLHKIKKDNQRDQEANCVALLIGSDS